MSVVLDENDVVRSCTVSRGQGTNDYFDGGRPFRKFLDTNGCAQRQMCNKSATTVNNVRF